MDDDLFADESDQPKKDNLFGWTVLILLLLGFAFASWIGSYYLFGHPENPNSYKFLRKLKKIDPPKRFELTAAPAGKFYTSKEFYEQYWAFAPLRFRSENEVLLRDYLRNFQETKKLVPYVVGRFTILQSFELTGTDLFPSGVVAVAQSVDFPQVLIEHVYTAPPKSVPMLKQMLATGLDIKLERTNDLSSVIHVEKLYDGKLIFTVVPLLYGSYALKQGSGNFSLEPPGDVHLEAGLPVVKPTRLEAAFKTFAAYRKSKGLPETMVAPSLTSASSTPAPSTPLLVRVEASPPPTAPTPSPTPKVMHVAVATPTPKLPKTAKASPTPTKQLVAKASPFPTPVMEAVPIATPAPLGERHATSGLAANPPAATPAPGVKLEPFIAAAPVPGASAGSWRVFRPGQMPRGRIVESQGASQLADSGVPNERIYLGGEFVVTASGAIRGENRAVLRPSVGGKAAGSTRIIVEFPAGMAPPTDGSQIARNEQRPFLVTDVRRGTDGQVNIYVREITTPQ